MTAPDAGTTHPDAGTTNPDAGGGTCTDTWANYARGFFQTNCSRCHTQFGTQQDVSTNASQIQNAIDTGAMPRDTTLSSSQIMRIDNWFGCGMP
jgi:hypothetical protein